MNAKDERIGKRIRRKDFKNIILEVKEIDGQKMWKDIKEGDIYKWIDEDLYNDLDYI